MCADPPPEVIAFHEAGHVIAAWALGVRVRSATILKEDDRYGSRFGGAAYDNSLERVGPRDHIVILMAGAFSQRRLGAVGRAWAAGCYDDRARLNVHLTELAGAELDQRAPPDMPLSRRIEEMGQLESYHCFRLRRRTLDILRRHEAQVTAIAQALLTRITLSEAEILHVLTSAR